MFTMAEELKQSQSIKSATVILAMILIFHWYTDFKVHRVSIHDYKRSRPMHIYLSPKQAFMEYNSQL